MMLLVNLAVAWNGTGEDWSWQTGPLEQPITIQTSGFPASIGTEDAIESTFPCSI